MKLFHVSEESNIPIFHPRTPTRRDLADSDALVWAVFPRYEKSSLCACYKLLFERSAPSSQFLN